MKVFLSADMEGTAGVTAWSETEHDKPDYPQFQALMTAEVVAACEGALAAGATEIIVKDAHHTGRNLLVDRLPAEVRVVRDWSGHPHSMMFGIDADCRAALFTGYHDAAGTDSNPLAHSFTGRIMRLTINGALASEFTVNAITAASLGVPAAFLSGDAGICAGAAALVPGIVTVPVSAGFGPATASLSPARARAAIRDGVARALSDLDARQPAPLADRWEVELEYTNAVEAYRGSFFPGVDYPAPRRLTFVREDWFEVLRTLRFLW